MKVISLARITRLSLFTMASCMLFAACGNTTSTISSTSTEIAAPTTTESPSRLACRFVKPSYDDSSRIAGDFNSKAATRYELINALELAAEKLREASSILSTSEKLVFDNAALYLNQIRVALVTQVSPPASVREDGNNALREFQQLCPDVEGF